LAIATAFWIAEPATEDSFGLRSSAVYGTLPSRLPDLS
jgi:hypothetical protein